MKKHVVLLLAIGLVALQKTTAQVPELVKDINATTPNSDVGSYMEFNNELYFSPSPANTLYKTDGTAAGTVLLKALTTPTMANGFISQAAGDYQVANGNLFLFVNVSGSNSSLWKTDGSAAGTVLVKEASGISNFSAFQSVTYNGLLFFRRGALPLWRTDGTDAGTFQLSSNCTSVFTFNGQLYLIATTATEGEELYKSDGTVAGTVLVKDFFAGTGSGSPRFLGTNGTEMFFTATDGVNGFELWKSDGTTAGTVLVKDINPGSAASFQGTIAAGQIGNTLLFTATDGVAGIELWKTDGTTAGTALVKDISAGSSNSSIGLMSLLNTELFFSANNGTNGAELWKTDGSTAGTQLVFDINPGANSASPTQVAVISNDIYYRATDAGGVNLWRTDGTPANTVKINVPGVASPAPGFFPGNLNGRILFTATAGTTGTELYYANADNTEATLVKDINPGTAVGVPGSVGGFSNRIRVINGKAVFTAQTPENGTEPWISDGTAAGTFLLKDILGNSNASNPAALLAVSNTIYFSATDGIAGNELWKSDGTSGGTVLVKDIQPGAGGQGVTNLCSNNGLLFFSGATASTNRELWVSDGTEAGTIEIAINPSLSASSSPASLVSFNNAVYFFANNGTNNIELHKSDGTVAGTSMVKDASTLISGFTPGAIVPFDGKLVYAFNDGTNGNEIWVSDGTSAGTVLNQNINAFAGGSSNPSNLVIVGSELFFTATDGVVGTELWKMTSTLPSGAQLVKDITAGASGSVITGLTNVNGTLYFIRSGNQLWKSNGTDATTVQLLTMATLAQITNVDGQVFFTSSGTLYKLDAGGTTATSVKNGTVVPQTMNTSTNLFVAGSTLYFNSSSFTPGTTTPNGAQLWKCNANELTASLVTVTTTAIPNPANFILNNNFLYFAADDLEHSRELYRLLLGGTLPLNLRSFSAYKQNDDALLQWTTANEINLNRFEVQRSDDGIHFKTFATILAGRTGYTTTDAGVFGTKMVVFYRLKSVDDNGRIVYSNSIKLNKASSETLTVFPNPVQGVVSIGGLKQKGVLKLYNADGKLLLQQPVSAQSVTIDMSNYAAGIYLLQYLQNGTSVNQKIVKQ